MADVTDSKSVGGNTVWVQVPPPAPIKNDTFECRFLLLTWDLKPMRVRAFLYILEKNFKMEYNIARYLI